MKKIIKIFSGALGVFVLCALMFSLSSKSEPNLSSNQCANLEGDNAQIQLYFPGGENPFRNSGFEFFVPTPDLRNGDFPGAGTILEDQNYYCTIVVTTPRCPNWEYKRVFDASNGNSNGLINIKIAPDGFDTVLEVTYHERIDGLGAQNFNKSLGNVNNTRVVYKHKVTYFNGWDPRRPQPVDMVPSFQKKSNTDLTPNKSAIPDDFSSVNDFIDNGL
ncbi:hypothetical protein AWE51_11840 [Aquimarina aggregata]|uniref:Uncharacterized protein n=1 Tax=Aquimarina aggregata TaxID=1642818 RepID=A0A162YMS4_9FLAO|nr:hypothetical protein [Aquimarina aggregata]KZS39237.1 hypothetical protein AWE51_11840 [Aquimarina aggregata]